VTGGGSEHHGARFRCPRQFGWRECVHGNMLPIVRNYNRTSQFLLLRVSHEQSSTPDARQYVQTAQSVM